MTSRRNGERGSIVVLLAFLGLLLAIGIGIIGVMVQEARDDGEVVRTKTSDLRTNLSNVPQVTIENEVSPEDFADGAEKAVREILTDDK